MSVIGLTALGWIGAVVAITMFVIAIFRWLEAESAMGFVVMGFLAVIVWVFAIVLYFNSTAVGQAQVKSWNAQSVGIQREIQVYSMTGDMIAEYSGVFNIEYDDSRVEIFDARTGERNIVYYQNGTIIVTEYGEQPK